MALGPFTVGDLPPGLIRLKVTRPQQADPFNGFDAAAIEILDPAGEVQTVTPATMEVSSSSVLGAFPAPFDVAGQWAARAVLYGPGAIEERSTWTRFRVREDSAP